MSRSKRKPYWKDRTRNNHWWKRKANKIVRRSKELYNHMFYKRLVCSWDWCDFIFYAPKDVKAYRK